MTTSPVMGITEEILGEIERAGWKLVPVDPTDDQLVAGQEEWVRGRRGALEDCMEANAIYAAMLAAAPAVPELEGDDLTVWRITLPSGEQCHFGTESMARAWGRGEGKVEQVDLKVRPRLEVAHTPSVATLAQQPAPAVPDGWRPQIVQGPRASVFYGGNRDEHLNRHVVVIYADEYEKLLSMLAAPAAPVAQEPPPVSGVVLRDGQPTLLMEKFVKPTDQRLYTAPPAAEQPECGCCGQTGPCDPDCDCAEQPDTVAVPRDVLRACRESLADGLETVGSAEAEWSTKDRALVARIDALLAGGDK